MFRANLTSNTLLSQLIPGLLLLAAILISAWRVVGPVVEPAASAVGAIRTGAGLDDATSIAALFAVAAFSAYVVAVFLGNLLAVVIGYLEVQILDRISARQLGIDQEAYAEEWYRYVDHLDEKRNPYISRVVDSFTFEFRTGLAGTVLGLAILFATPLHPVYGIGALLFSALLIKAGRDDHHNLAELRHRRFASSTLFSSDAEESLRKLVKRWCERQELRPLGKVATIWPLPELGGDRLDSVIAVLEEVRVFGRAIVYPAENDLITRAIASLQQRKLGGETAESVNRISTGV